MLAPIGLKGAVPFTVSTSRESEGQIPVTDPPLKGGVAVNVPVNGHKPHPKGF